MFKGAGEKSIIERELN